MPLVAAGDVSSMTTAGEPVTSVAASGARSGGGAGGAGTRTAGATLEPGGAQRRAAPAPHARGAELVVVDRERHL